MNNYQGRQSPRRTFTETQKWISVMEDEITKSMQLCEQYHNTLKNAYKTEGPYKCYKIYEEHLYLYTLLICLFKPKNFHLTALKELCRSFEHYLRSKKYDKA
ncbi:hypothetical protein BDA99DRAFT_539072 [Phascolomyces articulosus]|uniref:Uncharacterized protein n=1 Tax=Phascolomyces articulosus TaxID=60185 RepID=A0AAD5PC56_9FUNG|nr:hypothetical protein BDA99DRAFT_539072 [Phascolomyces articulosus]